MRCDQYIGLTQSGQNWVKKLIDNNYTIKHEYMCDQAWNPDPLTGVVIQTDDRIYKEEIQATPWSSGPMYFTRIAIYTIDNKLIGYMFSWKEDPDLHEQRIEFDYTKGTMYV